MRRLIGLALVLVGCSTVRATPPEFVFEERPGRSYTEGEARWRDALLRASVGGCKERLPPGSRLRPGIRDCVVNQVHVTNLSPHPLECRVTLVLPAPDDDGRQHIEHTIHIGAGRERWLATAYGPSTLVPTSFETRCVAAASSEASGGR